MELFSRQTFDTVATTEEEDNAEEEEEDEEQVRDDVKLRTTEISQIWGKFIKNYLVA